MTQTPFTVQEVWIFVSRGDDGEEGVCAMLTNEGWIPMVAADRNRLESLRPLARQIAAATNKEIKLIHMSGRQDVEVIRP